MLNETVRKNVIKLLITAKLNKNLIIPTRMIFDFIYRILVPSNKSSEVTSETMTDFLNNTMVNLLFTNISKGKLLKPIQELDVLKYRTKQADSIISELSVKDLSVICAEYLSDIKFRIFCNKLEEADNLSRISDFDLKKQFVKVIIRMIWLSGSSNFDEYYEMYNKYVYFLKGYNEKNVSVIKELVDFVYKAIFSWLGDEHSLYVQASKTQNVSLSYQLNIEDAFQDLPCRIPNASIFTSLQVPFKEKETEVSAVADIDYTLFCLLYRINSGYRPNKQDEENAVSFVNFMKKLVKAGQNKKQLILSRDANSFEYVLKKGKKLGEDVYEFGRKI